MSISNGSRRLVDARDLDSDNPQIPSFLRGAIIAQCLVVGWAALLMFGLPALGEDLWAWPTPAFNARYIGAVYAGALVPLLIFAAVARWVPGRLVLWMNFVFTTAVMAVMLSSPGAFDFGRFHTWVFWMLYVLIPIIAAVFLYRLRDLRSQLARPTPTMRRLILAVLAVAFAGYGSALIIAPAMATAFWPWPVDDFHARIYAAQFLSAAAGALVLFPRSAPADEGTYGGTLAAFSAMAIVGLVITNLGVPPDRQVDFAETGTAWFVGLHGAALLVGVALLAIWLRAQRMHQRPQRGAEPTMR